MPTHRRRERDLGARNRQLLRVRRAEDFNLLGYPL